MGAVNQESNTLFSSISLLPLLSSSSFLKASLHGPHTSNLIPFSPTRSSAIWALPVGLHARAHLHSLGFPPAASSSADTEVLSQLGRPLAQRSVSRGCLASTSSALSSPPTPVVFPLSTSFLIISTIVCHVLLSYRRPCLRCPEFVHSHHHNGSGERGGSTFISMI